MRMKVAQVKVKLRAVLGRKMQTPSLKGTEKSHLRIQSLSVNCVEKVFVISIALADTHGLIPKRLCLVLIVAKLS